MGDETGSLVLTRLFAQVARSCSGSGGGATKATATSASPSQPLACATNLKCNWLRAAPNQRDANPPAAETAANTEARGLMAAKKAKW